MFTGIVQAVGRVKSLSFFKGAGKLSVESPGFWEDVGIGDSIAIDGVCLTAKEMKGTACAFDVSSETIDRSISGKYRNGAKVNLEKALRPIDRLGGHLMQGHVDGIGSFAGKRSIGDNVEMDFEIPSEVSKYVVEKGSIAINGVSLTVAKAIGNRITIAVIPHTLAVTNLSLLGTNAPVNLECDIIAKYVEKLLFWTKRSGIDAAFLKNKGFI